MEEEPNDGGQTNPQQDMKDTKDAVKDGANLAKNAASGNYLGAIKDGIKLLGNKKARKIILISLLLPIIVIVAIAGSLFSVFDKVGDVIQSIVDGIISFFTINNKDWDGSITIDDEQVDKIIEGIEALGFDMEDLYLMGDIDYSTIDKESEEYKETMRKYIRKFYEAQATTETPFANLGTSSNKTYGAVYIYRKDENDKTELLKYTNYSNEDGTSGLITCDGKTVSSRELKDLRKKFSLDDDGKLVVPVWTESGDTITVRLKHIDYKNAISQYTTPMNFFVYLAMTVQNPEFVTAVTELVKDSKIEITLFDCVNEMQQTETYTYTEHAKGTSVIGAGQNKQVYEVDGTIPKSEVKKSNSISTNPIPHITYVKTWFCEQTVEYEKNDTGLVAQEPTILNKDNDETLADEQGPGENEEIPEGEVRRWKTDQQILIETLTRSVTYKETTRSEVIDRTGNKGDQGVKNVDSKRQVPKNYKLDENTTFLGLMDDYFKIPNTKHYEAVAKTNLVTGAKWLFGLLQKDARLQTLEQIMRYIMYKYTDIDYGVTSLDMSIFNIRDFTSMSGIGSVSAFGTNLSREEFIAAVQAYNGGESYSKLSNAAGDFYDICTSAEYNVNPCLAFAWACIETGYGKSTPGNNLFGFAIYNGQSSGATYSSYGDSIRDFCGWVVNASTEGTDKYNYAYSTAQKYATVNSMFAGKPENNAYAMFCIYMYLGDTHLCNEPDFDNPAGIEYYQSHGSTWGSGGRIQIYSMYELGGISTGEYKIRCGHSGATDLTSLQEKADYAQYCFEYRLRVAKTIFGNNCFLGEVGSIVEAAYMVADHFLNSGVEVHYAGNGVEGATNNGRTGVGYNIQASWDYPIENPSKYGIVCATFVSLSLWKAGLIDEATINQYPYNGCWGVENMLTQSSYANQWQKITSFAELQEGDIVFYPNRNHVYIYINGGKRLDQNYCVVSSSGDRSSMGKLLSADPNKFAVAYRYIGK